MRLALLFQRATDQPTPPSPLHHHQPAAGPAAARSTGAWLAGRPLPRLTATAVGTAVDPALHELRVASLDRGLLWNEATPEPSAAAAHSAPSILMRPMSAAFAAAPTPSSLQTADTNERIMQGLHIKAEMQRRRTAAAAAGAQLAGKLAAAAAGASASQLFSRDHVNTAVMVAASAAAFAASATVAAAFSLTPSCSIDTSAGTCESNSITKGDTGEALTFDAPSRVSEQSPVRCPEYMTQAGLLFTAVQPGELLAFGAAGMQMLSPMPNPGTSGPQPGTAISIPDQPSEAGLDASPAGSIVSDKENLSPAKPAVHGPAVGDVPASLRLGLSDHLVPGLTGRTALGSRPTLPPRGARRGPQAAVPAWQASAPSPKCRCRPRSKAFRVCYRAAKLGL